MEPKPLNKEIEESTALKTITRQLVQIEQTEGLVPSVVKCKMC
jgi:hypothetical protein